MSKLYTISVNEHILIATPIPRVFEVGERAVLEMGRNRLLPNFDHPAYRIARQEPFIETKSYTVGEDLMNTGRLNYSVPHATADLWESPVLPPVYTVNITTKVIPMLQELTRTLRENLKVFI